LGPSLVSQAGVALGLAASIQLDFQGTLFEAEGQLILATITGTVIILEVIGPILVKWAIEKADECYKKEGAVCEDEDDTKGPNIFVPPPKKTPLKSTSRRFSSSYLDHVKTETEPSQKLQEYIKQ